MIAKLTCDQVAEIWPVIRSGLQNDLELSIFGRHKYRETNILESLLSGSMEAWTSYEKEEDEETIILYTISLTSIYTDPCTKNRSFYIFSVLWYRDPPKEYLLESKRALTEYAKSKNCHTMSSATNRTELVEMASKMGVDTSFTLLYIDLEKE